MRAWTAVGANAGHFMGNQALQSEQETSEIKSLLALLALLLEVFGIATRRVSSNLIRLTDATSSTTISVPNG